MLPLEALKPGLSLVGLEPTAVASLVAVIPIAEGTVQVICKTPDGTLKDRLLGRGDEAGIRLATVERPWSFDGDGAAFQLTCEAKRIDLAFLFDPMMAVHTSNVEALPHQITAVYESMLPRQPLRFVLADDPGAAEHRDTLNYLHAKIAGVLGNAEAIITIHGGTHRDERRRLQALFRSDPDVRILVATDAAGEGVNLQNANLMVNYDLPWNPNRLEQRFGRIHRIGQTEVCHLWNLVADLSSFPPAANGRPLEARHIEVKGRVKGATTITGTRNEILYAFNQGEKFLLGVVFVNPDDSTDGPYHVRNPFDREPGWGVSSVNYDLGQLLEKAQST